MIVDNFADAPPSITEIRSDKSMKAKDWTPRDCLIATLRELDQGKIKPEQVIIVIAERTDDDLVKDQVRLAGPYTTFAIIGLLQQQIYKYNRDW